MCWPAGSANAATAGMRAVGRRRASRVGARSAVRDRLPGMRAGVRTVPAGRAADTADGRSPRTAGESAQLIAAAVQAGATRIVVGLGGSASTDGGRGLIEELGGLDAARRRLAGVELIAACDVEYPLVGPSGAARVFGPQKGADPATVATLEERLVAWAAELDAAAGRQVSAEPGAGAAGGIGAALLALGGRVRIGRRDHRRAHRAGRRHRGRRSGDHRRGKVRRPIPARQSGRRAGRGGAIVAGAGDRAGRSGRSRRRRVAIGGYRWPPSRSPTTPARCGWPWPTPPTS